MRSTVEAIWEAALLRMVREQAGAGAMNCGKVDNGPERKTYQCASACFAVGRPFYGTAGSQSGYFSRGDGSVSMLTPQDGKVVIREIFRKQSKSHPFRGGGLVRAPALLDPKVESRRAEPPLSGIVIIDVVISETGDVMDTRVMKPLPGTATDLAEELVQRARFVPAAFLEHPAMGYSTVIVDVRDGVLSMDPARR